MTWGNILMMEPLLPYILQKIQWKHSYSLNQVKNKIDLKSQLVCGNLMFEMYWYVLVYCIGLRIVMLLLL